MADVKKYNPQKLNKHNAIVSNQSANETLVNGCVNSVGLMKKHTAIAIKVTLKTVR